MFHGDASRRLGDTFLHFLCPRDDETPSEMFRDVLLWAKLDETHGESFRFATNLVSL